MEVTENLRRQLRLALDRRGMSPPELAAFVGVSPRAVNGWLRGETATIRPAHAAKVLQFLGDRMANNPPPMLRDDGAPYRTGPDLVPAGADRVRTPIVGMAAAAGYRDAIGAAAFLDDLDADGFTYWRPMPDGHLVFQVTGRSGGDALPPGSFIEVNFNIWPQSGTLALALTTFDELPVLKYYYRENYVVTLEAVDDSDDAASYRLDLKRPGDELIYWAHPVCLCSAPPPRRPRPRR